MTEISLLRLNLLRAGYLLLVVGLGSTIWPAILDPASHWELTHGVVVCMLGALSALSVLGLRYPLQMLPLLLFEVTWKSIWLVRIAWPLWSANRLDAATEEMAFECSLAAIFLVVIPWPYVVRHYLSVPGDPWLSHASQQARIRQL